MKNLEYEDKTLIFGISLIIIVLIGLIISLLFFMSKQDDDNYKKCIENYSVNYCKKSIYGIY